MNETGKARRYNQGEREKALARAAEIGPSAAGRELGIPDGTICNWRHLDKSNHKKIPPNLAVVPAKAMAESPAKPSPTKAGRGVAKVYTPSQRARILESAAVNGVTATAKEFGVTRFSIYDWQRKVARSAQGWVKVSPSRTRPRVKKILTSEASEKLNQQWRSKTSDFFEFRLRPDTRSNSQP